MSRLSLQYYFTGDRDRGVGDRAIAIAIARTSVFDRDRARDFGDRLSGYPAAHASLNVPASALMCFSVLMRVDSNGDTSKHKIMHDRVTGASYLSNRH